MIRSRLERGPSSSQLALILFSCFASLYVMERLWITSRETHYLREEVGQLQEDLAVEKALRQQLLPAGATPAADSTTPLSDLYPTAGQQGAHGGEQGVLFYSIRPSPQQPAPLLGPSVEEHPPTQPGDGSMLGQVDFVQAGQAAGWACLRGDAATQPLQVLVYVDGIKVAEVAASSPLSSPLVQRLCQAQEERLAAGFTVQLPPLQLGKHELRAFARSPDGSYKQELNQSPLLFKESSLEPDTEEQLRRKDAIIQVRNAQVAALWDELHTRAPWRNAVGRRGGAPLAPFGAALDGGEGGGAAAGGGEDDSGGGNSTRLLAFLGVNSGLNARVRRDILRRTWVPRGQALADLERERGVRIRFVVGQSEQKDDPMELQVQKEMEEHGDIIRLDMVDTYQDLSRKTLKMFGELPETIDADFYFKIDDDVGVNVVALAGYLDERRSQGNLYLGCMKSGQVLTERRWKWYEPEYWRFGDPAGTDGRINYMRHASGQLYGVSRPVAQYIGRNQAVLHRFANEDVTFGTWLVGLEVQYVDERRLCCDTEHKCGSQTGKLNVCLGYYEHACAGTCYAEQRLEGIYHHCLEDPFNVTHRMVNPHPDVVARQRRAAQQAQQQQFRGQEDQQAQQQTDAQQAQEGQQLELQAGQGEQQQQGRRSQDKAGALAARKRPDSALVQQLKQEQLQQQEQQQQQQQEQGAGLDGEHAQQAAVQ